MTEFEERLRRLLADEASSAPAPNNAEASWPVIEDRLRRQTVPGPLETTQVLGDPVPLPQDAHVGGRPRVRRPGRTALVLGLAAAIVAAVVGGVAVVGRHGTTTKVAVRLAPVGGDAAGVPPRFLLAALPSGFVLSDAQDVPAGSIERGFPGGRVVVLDAGPGGNATITVTATSTSSGGGSGLAGVNPAGTSTPVSVHGQSGQMIASQGTATLNWVEAGAAFTVSGTGDPSTLTQVADAVQPGSPSPADQFTLGPLPAGLHVAQTGSMADLLPRAEYSMSYTRENLDAPANDSIIFSVVVEGAIQQAPFFGLGGTPVALSGHKAQLARLAAPSAQIAPGGSQQTVLSWEETPGIAVGIITAGLTDAQILALANSLHEVSDAVWRGAVGAKLQPAPPSQPNQASHLVAHGITNGTEWQLSTSDPGAVGDLCIDFETGGGGSSGCGANGPGDLFRSSTTSATLLAGLVSSQVATVVVRADGSPTVIGTYPTITAAGWTDLRTVVLPLPSGGSLLDLVGLDVGGHEVAHTQRPPIPSFPPQPSPQAMPDFTVVGKGPVLVGGQLDGHPWTLQAAVLTVPSGGTVLGSSPSPNPTTLSTVCAVVTYARGASPPTCSSGVEPYGPGPQAVTGIRNAAVASSRRIFVVAIVDPNVNTVRASLGSGATQTFATYPATGASETDPRIAVIPVSPGTTLTAVTAVSNGRDLGTVSGNVPGQPGQSWNLGNSGGSADGGSYSNSYGTGSASIRSSHATPAPPSP